MSSTACSTMNGQNNDAIRSLYKDKLMLAPLVGGSDLSFRLLVRHYGAQVTFTEMCVAEYYIDRMKKRVKQYTYEFDPRDRPLILQLAGNSAEPIIKMANDDLFKGKIDGVDLNCGCPQSFALEKGYGCALLRNPDHLADMCMQIVRNIPYPLSVKIRLHDNVQTTIHILQRLRAVGVAAITVHGRYYWQKGEKRGVNDWEAIKQIKESLFDMPVIGNGDVTCFDDFRRFKEFSGVDSVMSGYGALLNPSLFQPNIIPLEEILEQYISIARQHQNKFIDILRHIAWILKQHVVPGFKAQLFECKNLEQVRKLLESLTPPVYIKIPSLPKGVKECVAYPKTIEEMNDKEKRQNQRRQLKQRRNMEKKTKFLHYNSENLSSNCAEQ